MTPSARAKIQPRRLALTLGAGAIVAAAALGIGSLLDDPARRSAEDVAQPIIVGAVAGQPIDPGTSADPAGSLPPISIVLDRPAPNGISRLEPSARVARLRELIAQPGADTRRWIELGHAYQALENSAAAERAYQEAARRDPSDVASQVGLAMVAGARGPAGLDQGAARLERLASENPNDQFVAFNRGWLSLYRRDVPTILTSWRRTVRLGPNTLLGRTATGLLRQITAAGANGTPSP